MSNTMGWTLVLATAFISGFSIFANKFGVSGIDSSVYVGLRSFIVAALLAALLLLRGQWRALRGLSGRQWAGLAAVGLVGGSVPFLLFFQGLQLTSAASASFLQKTMFVFVAVLAAVFLKEKIGKRFLLPAAAVLAGSFLLLGGAPAAVTAGNALVLAATVLWAVENTYSKRLLQEMPAGILAFGRMSFGAAFVLVFLLFSGGLGGVSDLGAVQWQWIAVSSFILLAYVVTWYEGLSRVSATAATSVLLLGAPVTAFLDYAFAGKTLLPLQAAGAVLLVAGVWGACWVLEKSPTPTRWRTRNAG